MKETMELPYVVGRRRIMVKISLRGLLFWKKGTQEKYLVEWGHVMPWGAVRVDDNEKEKHG